MRTREKSYNLYIRRCDYLWPALRGSGARALKIDRTVARARAPSRLPCYGRLGLASASKAL